MDLWSAVPQSQTGLTALYNAIKAGHNNELSKIEMNLKYIIIYTSKPTIHKHTTNIPYINQCIKNNNNNLENIKQVPLKFHFDNVQIKDRFIYLHNCTEEGTYGGGWVGKSWVIMTEGLSVRTASKTHEVTTANNGV